MSEIGLRYLGVSGSASATSEFPRPRVGSNAFALVVVCFLVAALVTGCGVQPSAPAPPSNWSAQHTSESANPSAVKPATEAIPLPQIAERTDDLNVLLQEIKDGLTPPDELEDARQEAEMQLAETSQRKTQLREFLAGAPTPLDVTDELRYWRARSDETTAQRRSLKLSAARLEQQVATLNEQEPEWQSTAIEVLARPGIEAIAERAQQNLKNIRATRLMASEQLNTLLNLQNLVAEQDRLVSDILLQLLEFRREERKRILEPDSRPLWSSAKNQQAEPMLRHSFDRSFQSTIQFLRSRKLATVLILVVYLLSLLAIFRLRHLLEPRLSDEVPQETLRVLRSPYSLALLVTLIGTGEYVTSAPLGIAFVFYLAYLVPVFRLLIPLLDEQLRTIVYVMSAFYVLQSLYLLVQLPMIYRREIYIWLVFAALASFGWLARRYRIWHPPVKSLGPKVVAFAGRTVLLFLAASLVANIVGFVSLAQVLSITALISPFVAVALYCGVGVTILIIHAVLRTPWAGQLFGLRVFLIERWSKRLLSIGALLLWLRAVLQLMTIYDSVSASLIEVFNYQFGIASVHFTLGAVLEIVLVGAAGYAVANAIVFLLSRLILPNLPLQRGVPYAITRVTYYVFLLLVLLAILSMAQVELNKFTLLTGALGVGLGFGLQNIVNNFVSGLILLFERPIHVGDTVEVGGLVGTVRRIGARSSTVLTFQGAEVIVPNSSLLSDQVINWTLSSPLRRVDIPVGVAYGTDPEQVIKLLVQVAESCPGVLLERAPVAFFIGFGDSALRFELRFWCARHELWFQLQSDVSVAVARALRENSIEIPFPQRDLHVRSIDATAAAAFAAGRRLGDMRETKQKASGF